MMGDLGAAQAALEEVKVDSSKNEHVDEITVDDFFNVLIRALDNDKDVFDSEAEMTSDPWFGKQTFGGSPRGINLIDPWRFIDQIYGSPFGLNQGFGGAQMGQMPGYGVMQPSYGSSYGSPYGSSYGMPSYGAPSSYGPPSYGAPPSYGPPAYGALSYGQSPAPQPYGPAPTPHYPQYPQTPAHYPQTPAPYPQQPQVASPDVQPAAPVYPASPYDPQQPGAQQQPPYQPVTQQQ